MTTLRPNSRQFLAADTLGFELDHPGVGPGGSNELDGALQYPPPSVGEEARPQPPARMLPQPRRATSSVITESECFACPHQVAPSVGFLDFARLIIRATNCSSPPPARLSLKSRPVRRELVGLGYTSACPHACRSGSPDSFRDRSKHWPTGQSRV